MTALLFGSISTIADSSELQRESFNEAFHEHGLDWRWEGDEYRELLKSSGGRDRVADYAAQQGLEVDADAIHATKSARFQQKLRAGVQPRPGVAETIAEAKEQGLKVGFVTTTARENVDALLEGTEGVSADDFDVIVDVSSVPERKPAGDAYSYALEQLGETAGDAVAIEDNVGGVESAAAAGVPVVAFPNQNTGDHDFPAASKRVDRLSLADVR
jgi:HAD superfamily hydrolase (TIGR01509 family)